MFTIRDPGAVRGRAHNPLTGLIFCGLLGGLQVGCSAPEHDSPAPTYGPMESLAFLRERDVHQPQFAFADDDTVYVVWWEPGAGGSNLFLSRRGPSRAFGRPVRINDETDSVLNVDLDETRAEVGLAGDVVGIAWITRDREVRAAISRDSGTRFEPSVKLNSDEGEGIYRGFVGTDVDDRGVLHAAWIDGRYAPKGREEPAELMYARLENGIAIEQNLTAEQTDSICGCCRIDVEVRGESVAIAFRNTEDGYRDIFRVVGDLGGAFGAPARLGPPMWELRGCPTFGPANVGNTTIWGEASTGHRRLLAAGDSQGDFQVLLEDSDDWSIDRPPRPVVGSKETMILVPGRPTGKVLVAEGESWRVVADDLPSWAMSAMLDNGELALLGATKGVSEAQIRRFDF